MVYYRTVPSAIWEIFSEFVIFCKLSDEPLGKRNKSKIWETRKIFANIATKQPAITTLSLNICWNQMYRELNWVLNNCIGLAKYNLMLTWYKKQKTASNNFTWLYLVFHNSFVFPYFNSDILYSVYLFSIRLFFCNQFIFECFVPNIRLILRICTY